VCVVLSFGALVIVIARRLWFLSLKERQVPIGCRANRASDGLMLGAERRVSLLSLSLKEGRRRRKRKRSSIEGIKKECTFSPDYTL